MVLPLFKLGGLLFKTVMKPITNGVQGYAKRSPRFAQVSYGFANIYFKSYNRMCKTLRLPYQVTPLTHEQAVQIGIDFLGESVLFAGAAGMLYYEVSRSGKSYTNNVSKSQYDDLENRIKLLEENKKK